MTQKTKNAIIDALASIVVDTGNYLHQTIREFPIDDPVKMNTIWGNGKTYRERMLECQGWYDDALEALKEATVYLIEI